MADSSAKVDNLKRLTTSITVGKDRGTADLISDPIEFGFIYGIGPAGLTPFECELGNRSAGDNIAIEVGRGALGEMFGHLQVGLPAFLGELDSFYLTVAIDEVAPAAPREVIRALAEIADCGDQCCGH